MPKLSEKGKLDQAVDLILRSRAYYDEYFTMQRNRKAGASYHERYALMTLNEAVRSALRGITLFDESLVKLPDSLYRRHLLEIRNRPDITSTIRALKGLKNAVYDALDQEYNDLTVDYNSLGAAEQQALLDPLKDLTIALIYKK